jgi:tRNA (mo5U34)-methyltransferase
MTKEDMENNVGMENGKLTSEIAKISWFHTFNFGNGIVTSGSDDSYTRLPTLHLPEDLSGMTVLDIGSWDGFFAFEAERRGASRVLATDSFCWSGDGWGTKDGFNLVRNTLNSKVEDMEIDVLELCPEKVGSFDLVLCLGVLYHMRNPLLALERIFSVTKHQLILDTHVDCLVTKRPMIAFYPGKELNNDATNWCGPNFAAVNAMLKTVGFRHVELVHRQFGFNLGYRFARAIKRKLVNHESFLLNFAQDRMVFHAWR